MSLGGHAAMQAHKGGSGDEISMAGAWVRELGAEGGLDSAHTGERLASYLIRDLESTTAWIHT